MPRPRSERRSAWPVTVIVALLLLPVLYVASFGPAVAMANRGQISWDTCGAVYRPVEWACGRSAAARAWVFPYVSWWDDHWPGESFAA